MPERPYRPQPVYPPAPQHHAPVPTGVLDLTIQGSEWTSNMIVPTVVVNGHRVVSRYGRQPIVVPAGPVRIEIHGVWMRRYGHAALDVMVRPGEHVPVFYAAPYHQFTSGSIGHVQQQSKGLAGLFGIVGGTVAVVMVFVFFVLLMAM